MNLENIAELDLSNVFIPTYLQSHLQVLFLFQRQGLINLEHHFYLFQFWKINNVKRMCLDNTGICSLSPSVGRLKDLEVLSLENNSLSDLPNTLEFCQNLTTLKLKGNNFTSIPGVVLKLNKLKALMHSCSTSQPIKYLMEAIPCALSADAVHTPASLQMMCVAAVFVNRIDYWRQGMRCSEHFDVTTIDHLVSHAVLCHICGKLVSQGNNADHVFQFVICSVLPIPEHTAVKASLLHYLGLSDVPFLIHACSKKCQQTLVSHFNEFNLVGWYLNVLYERCIDLCVNGFNPILSFSMNTSQGENLFCL